jgi:peptidoglycan/LPS O-acetylase OafA/YrhL
VRRDLEGLRAIAVLGVVIYHCRNAWLPGGFVGVDVFFVLSGFFITGLLLREAERSSSVDLLAFWGRRARRLLPVSALVLIGTVLAGLLFVDSIDAHRFAQDGVYAALFSVNWHYAALGTSYLADPAPSPLVHYWSLGVEEQFYLVWPVVLLLLTVVVGRRRPSVLKRWVGGVALAASVVSFLLAWHQTYGLQPYAYFATYARVWQLGLGAVIAAAAVSLGRLPLVVRTGARWIGVGTIAGFYLAAPLDLVYPGWIAAVPTVAAALIIVAGLPCPSGLAVAGKGDLVWLGLRSRVAQLLGRYSYGWYLWHWPPLVLLPLIRGHAISTRGVLACAGLSLAAAVVSYHGLEHPVRASRFLTARRGRRSLALGATLIVVGAGSAQAISSRADWQSRHTYITTADGARIEPQPGVEAAQLGEPKKDGCEVAIGSSKLAPECRYLPDTGHGDVVLVGDSHAAQWYPAVAAVAKQRSMGLRVWTRQSCPLADVTKIYNAAPNTMCNRWRDDVMTRLIADRPSLVIVADLVNQITKEVDAAGRTVTGAAAQALFRAGLETELARLRAAGLPVLLIRDNPAFAEEGPKCVLEHSDDLPACSLPIAKALGPPLDLEAARAVPGVHVLDVTDAFCDGTRCFQVVGSTLAYHDFNHMTETMNLSLAPRLAAAVAAISVG